MKLISFLLVAAVCLGLSPAAHADAISGNPDQRPSFLLGFGYGSGRTQVYRFTGAMDDPFLSETTYHRYVYSGLITLPATRDASFLVGFSWVQSPAPDNLTTNELYSVDRVQTVSAAVRIFIP